MPGVLDLPESPLTMPPPPTPAPAAAGPAPLVHAAPPPGRDPVDARGAATKVYDNVLNAFREIEPISNSRFTLSLKDVDYAGEPTVKYKDRKRALLRGESLTRKIRGTWELADVADGKVIGTKTGTIARVPSMTPDGTFVMDGVDYTLANQLRLRPGVFSRITRSGMAETHINTLPGKGLGHRYLLDPESGLFKLRAMQAEVPLMPVLKAAGITDKEIKEAWGEKLYRANLPTDNPGVLDRIAGKFVRDLKPGEPVSERLAAVMAGIPLDPEVTSRTLGHPYARLEPAAMLAATKKLLAVSRQEADPDDRDAMPYQVLFGPEDLFEDKARRAAKYLRPMLWKITNKQSLDAVGPNPLGPLLQEAITSSGLGAAAEEVNLAELLGARGRVSRMGEGAISSRNAIPDEARQVLPSHLGFVDGIVTPESESVGVDGRLASGIWKGDDGKVYSRVTDRRTGKQTWIDPSRMADAGLELPLGPEDATAPYRVAVSGGKVKRVDPGASGYGMDDYERAYSHLSNLVPLKSTMKAHRTSMAARMITQALGLAEPEAPLVQAGISGPGDRSYHEEYGKHLGAVHADVGGRVLSVTPDGIKIKGDDGKVREHDLADGLVFNRKSYVTHTPTVGVGDRIGAGQILAKSNFTDNTGAVALGKNLRTAYLADRGYNFEDAVSISEGAAKLLKSVHAYPHSIEYGDDAKKSRNAFISLFPATFDRKTLDSMDPDGVVKVGTKIEYGHPLVLQATPKEAAHNKLVRGRATGFRDDTETWAHHDPGVVTDVEKTAKGVTVVVRAESEMKVGDKLCYDPETKLLTKARGWVPVGEVTTDDEVFTLNPETEYGEWHKPTKTMAYAHDGPMYKLVNAQLDMLVTPEHRLWVARPGEAYGPVTAQKFWESKGEWQFKKDCKWKGEEKEWFDFPKLDRKNASRTQVLDRVRMDDWLEFLGYYIAEGWVSKVKGNPQYVKIGQFRKSPSWDKIDAVLQRLGLRYRYSHEDGRFEIGNAWFAALLAPLGNSYSKRVPAYAQERSTRQIAIFFAAYMAGDGYQGPYGGDLSTSSEGLIYDLQLLCAKQGWCAHVKEQTRTDNWAKARHWRIRVNKSKLRTGWRKRNANYSEKNFEGMVGYAGTVHCVTVPNHILYICRGGKIHWSMNSGAHGDKGICARIIPDEQMPQDENGRPFHVLVNPATIPTRENPSQLIEAMLSKAAEARGKRYAVKDFSGIPDMSQYALGELKKYGLKAKETVFDPSTGRKIEGVTTGPRFFMKLHHVAESKGQARGLGGYSADMEPAKTGGPEGSSKRASLLAVNALLAHGAYGFLEGMKGVRGQRNDDRWAAFMAGDTPPNPQVPFVHRKFFDLIRAGGVNPVRRGPRVQLMALVDKDVDELAGTRELQNAETVDWAKSARPIDGGLFDPSITGGHGANRWSSIRLHEPMPSPVMEEPIRRVLGLTESKFRDVLSGKLDIQGKTGPSAIKDALTKINLKSEVPLAAAAWRNAKGSARDDLVKRWSYLKHADRLDVHPGEWVLSRAPVLPPAFRPVSIMQATGRPLIADPNLLYRELFNANSVLKDLTGRVPDVSDERLAVYDALKAVTGLGDPTDPKNQARRVKGALRTVFGDSSKYGMVQRKLIGGTVDAVGRAVIVPDPELDMDEVKLPENKAWTAYAPFVVRRLSRRGFDSARAAKLVESRSPEAKAALLEEMGVRPIVATRDPILHKYGVMAFYPKLASDEAMHLPNVVYKGFGADNDGDAMNYHVAGTDEEVKDAHEKMLPSKNLLSSRSFKAHQLPSNEMVAGLHHATANQGDEHPAMFATSADAARAFVRGEIAADRRIVIMRPDEGEK